MLSTGPISSTTGYGPLSGTSMATPQVASVVALLWGSPYGSSNETVVSRLYSTADSIAGTGGDWTYGRVNNAAAVGAIGLASPASVYDGLAGEQSTQTSINQISAHWTAVVGASGYSYEIGTSPGLGDVVGWTDNGPAVAMTQTGLTLSPNVSYFTSVRAYDSSHVPYGLSSSSGVRALPPTAAVSDGPGADLTWQASSSQLSDPRLPGPDDQRLDRACHLGRRQRSSAGARAGPGHARRLPPGADVLGDAQ